MVKWQATLSIVRPYNYTGIQNIGQGDRNTKVLEAMLVKNASPLDLTGYEAFSKLVIDNKYPIQCSARTVNVKKRITQHTLDKYSM